MTELQYQRWKNLSLRVAHRGLGLRLKKSRRFVGDFVKDFFRTLDREYFHVNEILPVDWDEKWQHDRNDTYRQIEFLRDRVENWDHTDSHPTYRDRYGHSTNGPYICDIVSIRLDEGWNPHYYGDDRKYEQWDELWGGRIRCCLRIGIDMAVAPSAGVMGFTAGDIRRMYRGNVPEWMFPPDEPLEVQHFVGVVPGVGLAPGERTMIGTFGSLPDDAQVWL
jgi:hypothetical protein